MEQIRLKWLEDKARHSFVAPFPGAVADPVHLDRRLKSTSGEKRGTPLT